MYIFSDLESIQALPDIVTIPELSQAIGLPDERKIPYIRIQKRIIIFKEHLLEGLSQQSLYADASKLNALVNLPEVFLTNRLVAAFRISHGLAYIIAHSPGFPAVTERDRIIVDKHGLIRRIKKNGVLTDSVSLLAPLDGLQNHSLRQRSVKSEASPPQTLSCFARQNMSGSSPWEDETTRPPQWVVFLFWRPLMG